MEVKSVASVAPIQPEPEVEQVAQLPSSESQAAPRDNGPIPMSFPSFLRAPGISDRFAHLRAGLSRSEGVSVPVPKKNRRDDKAGKRWVRRSDNARFVGNPHIVVASSKDYTLAPPSNRATFPEPLSVYLSRNSVIPSAEPTTREPGSANAGRFSMSLKGMRRELRKSGPRTEQLVKEIEEEIVTWLKHGGVLMDPDVAISAFVNDTSGTPIGTSGAIVEVSKTPLQLVWSIADDSFARYVVHCSARYHSVVSFSKDTSGQRLTYLLRPNVTRPDFFASAAIATPPATESELSTFDVESDFTDTDGRSDVASLRDRDIDSDMEGAPPQAQGPLSDIAESTPGSPAVFASQPSPLALRSVDDWSVLGDSDIEGGDELIAENDLASSVGSLSLQDPATERTPRAMIPGLRHAPLRTYIWDGQRRSASSPSRSPARRVPPRQFPRVEPPSSAKPPVRSFYEYLFS